MQPRIKGLARRRQRNASRPSLEQPLANELLEPTNLVAEGGRRNREFVCSPREAQMAGRGLDKLNHRNGKARPTKGDQALRRLRRTYCMIPPLR